MQFSDITVSCRASCRRGSPETLMHSASSAEEALSTDSIKGVLTSSVVAAAVNVSPQTGIAPPPRAMTAAVTFWLHCFRESVPAWFDQKPAPRQTCRPPAGGGPAVGVRVGVAVAVLVAVAVRVAVLVEVPVGVAVRVGVRVGVSDAVTLGVFVTVDVAVAVGVEVGVAV